MQSQSQTHANLKILQYVLSTQKLPRSNEDASFQQFLESDVSDLVAQLKEQSDMPKKYAWLNIGTCIGSGPGIENDQTLIKL